MAAHIKRELDVGKSAEDIFNYLSIGGFDPNNPTHIKRVAAAVT
jgi:hypothetical protein